MRKGLTINDSQKMLEGKRSKQVDPKNKSVIKFQEIVEKHFMTKTLSQLHAMKQESFKWNKLIKEELFKDSLEHFFPEKTFWNIGVKFDQVSRNLFLNEFFYTILSNIYHFQDQTIFREYFCLYSDGPISEQALFELSEKIDLNGMFMAQVEKDHYYSQIRKTSFTKHDYKDPEKMAIREYYKL